MSRPDKRLRTKEAADQEPTRVLVVLASGYVYGMERAVIEIFGAVEPSIIPHFLIPYTTLTLQLPVFVEVEANGFAYSFFCDHMGWTTLAKPKSLRSLWRILWTLLSANIDALRACRRQDVIYIPSLKHMYLALLACALFRLKGKRVVFAFHDQNTHRPHMLRLTTFLASDLVYHTELSALWLKATYPYLATRRSAVIPHVVDTRRRSAEGDLHQISQDRRHIVFVGQVSRHKGVDLLIDAFLSLMAGYPDVDLHIIGACGDVYFESVLQERLKSIEPKGRVRHWGYRRDVHGFLEMAYVYVQPSRPSMFHESFGRGVVEAMSVGVPAVVFRSGALQATVIHGTTGLICEEESADCLAQALRAFLDDPVFRDDCGQAAQERYRQLYSRERVGNQWRALFNGSR